MEERQLRGATDDRALDGPPLARVGQRLEGDPRRERLGFPFRDDRIRGRIRDDVARLEIRLLTHDDAVGRRTALKPGGGVHHVPRDHRLAERGTRVDGHDCLTGIDGDSDLQRAFREAGDVLPNDQCRAHGTLGVVAIGERRTEDAHHGVTDELLYDPPEGLDLAANQVVVRSKDGTDVLGVEHLRAPGEADEVDEDDGDDSPFFARRGVRRQGEPAGQAEAGNRRVLLVACCRNAPAQRNDRRGECSQRPHRGELWRRAPTPGQGQVRAAGAVAEDVSDAPVQRLRL